jgi:TonB family protein
VSGTVRLRFNVEADGGVREVSVVESTTENRVLDDCLLATARTWTLPAPPGGPTTASHTFVFEAAVGPAANGWREGDRPVAEGIRYPQVPELARRGPVRRRTPGVLAMGGGWLLFSLSYVGSLPAAFGGVPELVVPVFGPFIASARVGQGSALIWVPVGLLQATGAGLAAYGHVRFARWRRARNQAALRSFHGSVSPLRGGAAVSLGGRF